MALADHSLPLFATPRTCRLAKALGHVGERRFNFRADENYHPNGSASPSKLSSLRLRTEQKELTRSLYEIRAPISKTSASTNISTQAEVTLSAPGMCDDFYSRLADWSSDNLLAVATQVSVNYRNMETSAVGIIARFLDHHFPTCIEWGPEPGPSRRRMAVAVNAGLVYIYDALSQSPAPVYTFSPQEGANSDEKAGTLSWRDANVLTTGYEDGKITTFDTREPAYLQWRGRTVIAHRQRVAGAKWSPDGRLLATGGGDGVVICWDPRMPARELVVLGHDQPVPSVSSEEGSSDPSPYFGTSENTGLGRRWRTRKHTTTVKALAWCSWAPDVLASGGGVKDGTIRFWNASTGAAQRHTSVIYVGAQVSSLHFAPGCREIVSTLGFAFAPIDRDVGADAVLRHAPRKNGILVHKYPKGEVTGRILDFAHGRISDSCLSPDGTRLVTCGADETIRIYKIFGKQDLKSQHEEKLWRHNVIR